MIHIERLPPCMRLHSNDIGVVAKDAVAAYVGTHCRSNAWVGLTSKTTKPGTTVFSDKKQSSAYP
jgi:hypothetical protein